MLFMGVGMSFVLNPKLALVFVLSAPILAAILAFIVHKVSPLYVRQQKAVDHVNSRLQESLTAIRAVKAFVRGAYEEEQFDEVNQELMSASRDTFRHAQLNMPAFQVVMYTAVVLIMWFGGRFIMVGSMTVGQLTGFLSYVLQVMNSLMMISNVFLLLTRSLASARRIREVLEERPELADPSHPVSFVADGSIEFRDVSFKYVATGSGDDVLSHISFDVKPGQFVALVGGTGTGKSSLVNLIPRFYDVTGGAVLLDGVDVRDYPLEELRSRIGMVLQTNVLFTGTIRDNLKWGKEDATEEEIIQAAKDAQAYDFIMALPDGFDTLLTQGGTNVSGGQKQRLCIARAMLRKPAVLILDDSTSAVDSTTEAAIRESFAKNLRDTTIIMIAQRISSVQYADEILILDDDHIAGRGTHEELLASNRIYQEIYQSQQEGVGE